MRNIAVVTGSRAEYGVLKNTLEKIAEDKFLSLKLIVTGTHLSQKYGYTIDEIKKDGFDICETIPILMDCDNKDTIAKEMGLAMIQFSQVFNRIKPDILLILGDRYEIFAVASTAMAMSIPIAHISGGEITEGAIDEQIRHAITKMCHIHFPGAVDCANNIIKMGEEGWRVFNVGEPGIENIKTMRFLDKEELKKDLEFEVDEETLLVTYHPVTLEYDELSFQIDNLIEALNILNKKTIITYPNADNGGSYIIDKLNLFSKNNTNVRLVKNLGSQRYLSVMKYCGAVVGNSSSALIEAPYLKKTVVNIGNRQKGRLMADNIICSSNCSEDIVKAVNIALSDEFKEKVKNTISLYGDGNTSSKIVEVLKNIDINEFLLKKKLIWS